MKGPRDTPSENGLRKTRLLDRRRLSTATIEVDFTRTAGFSFAPGQRIRLFHADLSRDYSLVNGPEEKILTLCVRLVKGGAFSERLQNAAAGETFLFSGPHGYFVFQPSQRPAVWVATGTGIAPFASMCRSGITEAAVIHGVRTARELYYEKLFQNNASGYTPCISHEKAGRKGAFPGRVTRFLEERLPAGTYDFYLCGRREMIRDATLIIDERFTGSRIFTEIFF